MKNEKTMYDHFSEYSEARPNDKFIFDETRAFTVREAFSAVCGIANDLTRVGVKPKSLVVLRCTRSVDACLIYYALQFIGATAILTDPHDGAEQFLSKSGVAFSGYSVITNESADPDIAANGGFKIVINGNAFDISVSVPPRGFVPNFTPHRDAFTLSTVVFTSGSTGKSKAVMLSQDNILKISTGTLELGWYLDGDSAVAVIPFHHVFGLSLITTALVARYSLFFPRSVELESILENIEKYRITRMNGVPSLYLAMARANETARRDLTSLRTGFIGGAPVTEEQFRYIEKTLNVTMLPVYGMSECIGIACSSFKDDVSARAVTNGRFYAMSTGYILGDDGKPVPQGCEGEVCVSSPSVMLGYYGDAEATAEAIDTSGRLHTGDLGFVDDSGRLHISGRKKDIIIRNGINISSGKIEAALTAVKGVLSAAVVGVKHEKYGEAPCALVVADGVSESDIRRALAEKLEKNELPEKIMFADELPLTGSGKTDKQKIKDMFGNG